MMECIGKGVTTPDIRWLLIITVPISTVCREHEYHGSPELLTCPIY